MIIQKPYIEQRGDVTAVCANIINEVTKEEKIYFFSVQNEYAEYLISEHADAFVLAVLCTAIETGQDISVEGTVSDSFYYHFKSLSYLTAKSVNCREAILKAQSIEPFQFNPNAVGTAFSGGVDSLATFINHRKDNPDCPEAFKITHLTLFSYFAYGREYEKAYPLFIEDANRLQVFADQEQLPLIQVDSNICELIEFSKHLYGFTTCFVHYICAGVIVLQKLFKTYLISSGYTIDKMKASSDQSYTDQFIARLLSNNDTTITVAEATLNRLEKTRAIAPHTLARKSLNVCWFNQCKDTFNWTTSLNGYLNCGDCAKCKRTLATLDILDEVEHFGEVFDLKKYYSQREDILFEIYHNRGSNIHFAEISKLMRQVHPELISKFRVKDKLLKFRQRILNIIKK